MNPNTLFIGWNRAVEGREAMAGELFSSMLNYFGKLQAEGTIESFEPCILTLHGGDLNGFVLVKATPENITKVRHSDDLVKLVMGLNHCATGVGAIEALTGSELQTMMQKWGETVANN